SGRSRARSPPSYPISTPGSPRTRTAGNCSAPRPKGHRPPAASERPPFRAPLALARARLSSSARSAVVAPAGAVAAARPAAVVRLTAPLPQLLTLLGRENIEQPVVCLRAGARHLLLERPDPALHFADALGIQPLRLIQLPELRVLVVHFPMQLLLAFAHLVLDLGDLGALLVAQIEPVESPRAESESVPHHAGAHAPAGTVAAASPAGAGTVSTHHPRPHAPARPVAGAVIRRFGEFRLVALVHHARLGAGIQRQRQQHRGEQQPH